ncbi:HNH endonuclease [Rhodococcoides fascians]|uniref:HNH endonuclease n=1 Tax=Rhodococcoides fascians TaxID=1828 RepID=UPI00050C73DA|nr:HNH endonuclease [Rhodococcus fascians]
MALTKRLRFEILRRDNHLCRYCGATAPDVKLTVDHVVPTSLGGSDEPSNLVTACADCNSGKSATPPGAAHVDDVRDKALVWAAAIEAVGEQRAADLDRRRLSEDQFLFMWEKYRPHQFASCDIAYSEWQTALDRFLEAGLTDRDIGEMVKVAMASRVTQKWKYFCGCCWALVRQTHADAAELIGKLEGEVRDAKEADDPSQILRVPPIG